MVSRAVIAGMGVATPAELKQSDAWDGFFRDHYGNNPMARRLFQSTGITTRHAAVDPTIEDISQRTTAERMERYLPEAVALGRRAALSAIDNAGIAVADIGLFTVVSCTGYVTPGADSQIAEQIGLPVDAQRIVVGHMGCYAALPGLRSTADYVGMHDRAALLLCVELASVHVQPASNEVEQMVAHALFSDGAAATVVVPGEPVAGQWEVVDVASVTDVSEAALMKWVITDNGFRMSLSTKVPDVLARHVSGLVNTLLVRNELTIADVDAWAVHPGGPRILEVVGEQLKLDDAALGDSYGVLNDYGNCSSPTVLIVLDRIRSRSAVNSGGYVVALAFGPGLTLCAALLRTN